MKSVKVYAANLKRGDIINGSRVKAIHRYPYRFRGINENKYTKTGVLVVVPNKSGNKLDTLDFRGDETLVVKRPKYNYRRS